MKPHPQSIIIPPHKAVNRRRRYPQPHPWTETLIIAAIILMANLILAVTFLLLNQ